MDNIINDISNSKIKLWTKAVYKENKKEQKTIEFDNIKANDLKNIEILRNLIIQLKDTSNWNNLIREKFSFSDFISNYKSLKLTYEGINFFIDCMDFPSHVYIFQEEGDIRITVELTDGSLSNYDMFGC